ncbi:MULTISPECIES: carboxypeptidase M32 [Aminobacter]|jgi:carboxypeptidase Taq|uniref:Metal-dependent carboxypeptidase n=1 Tax=Aminobacter ciceronei TaxID=150723 RepID=A0ABR6C6W0_9HYPH|nr:MULTISPECIES: carboxypeptidase M32 [Aminobacter]MBA8906989.1 carboxypeptidase Taq [Aminobacter ciceronei]MBA9020753.1 carboxypeptidase Taq [Aminobacter ciceronei]MRX35962.1 carboxypeptidase M32 [Aminobacter sp. MDW-2]QNH35818.1 carboxypeptidase M32 [Aminobacter sp. MDW-2]BBD40040.1 peptidase M32 [Aminobacter sp. SS-2016]
MSFARLDELGRKLEALEHALAILGADEATHMAVGGGAKRAEALSALAGMHHRQATAPEISDWIAAAETEALNDDQRLAVREFRRQYTNMTCLPTEFVERQTAARLRCEQLWRDLRAKNDWAGFQPALEGIVAIAREEAALRSEALGLDPYDALMEQYDPGNRVADITPVFTDLKAFLRDFVPEALAVQQERLAKSPKRPLSGVYAIERQRELGLAMMGAVGFDLTRGSLSVSHHPFCGGVPSDVRITTRYKTSDFLSALMGVLHETGHALYEQNLPEAWSHWPLGKARGMAVHESQSLFVEKQLGRNPAFWQWALPLVEQHLGERWSMEEILPHVHHVERGLIRVDADEVTYPLHVILRYELEQELISGRLAVADLPEAWDARMRDYLGLSTIDNPADGPMQDVHWPSAAFGYFPSYTLGAMMAAQQWAALSREHPSVDDEIARGHFETVNAWRRDKIWSQASRWSTPDLLERATGERLNAAHFTAHLKKRYGR